MIGKNNKKTYSAIKISKLGSVAAMTQAMNTGAYGDFARLSMAMRMMMVDG
ncbi:hypothetical protein [Pseudanabaena sp. PCC 6802]|uniref:hypothetical protein n=1 Tax=Pseudanabaena sp. PCC 6802 TaxID=118173 RepID=UPI00034CF6BD|nr:hypothetical protein [Pseudanabaena sp. PCC 6802]